jgi:hypothetical protein
MEPEERMLALLATAAQLRAHGQTPPKPEGISINTAAAESKPYCPAKPLQLLPAILAEESRPLLQQWLDACIAKGWIVTPDLLPSLLETGFRQHIPAPLLLKAGGERAAWLGRLHPAWRLEPTETLEEVWFEGKLEDRKKALARMRQEHPAAGSEALMVVWTEENAAGRTTLLRQLEVNLSEADLPWLESLLAEKSKQVRDVAVDLLKRLPQSSVVKSYEQVLVASVRIKTEKALLGMISKRLIDINLPGTINEAIYQTGIQKLGNAAVNDELFLVYQLAAAVPPAFWESHLAFSPKEIIDLLGKKEETASLLTAIATAALTFNDQTWATALAENSGLFLEKILPLLPELLAEQYVIPHWPQAQDAIIKWAAARQTAWSPELATLILTHTARNPYQYTRAFFREVAHLLPLSVLGILEEIKPTEHYYLQMWNSYADLIRRLIQLKQDIQSAFQAP